AIVADREMDEAPLGLCPPVAVGRQLDLAHRVSLSPHPGPANTDREIVQFRMGLFVQVVTPCGWRNTLRYSCYLECLTGPWGVASARSSSRPLPTYTSVWYSGL